MASKALVLLGAAAAGVGALLMLSKQSSASPAQSGLPDGWTPPSGATFTVLPASNATTLPLNVWAWREQLGKNVLITNKGAPKTDFVAGFIPDNKAQQRGILAAGTTPKSGLIAQAFVAGLIL